MRFHGYKAQSGGDAGEELGEESLPEYELSGRQLAVGRSSRTRWLDQRSAGEVWRWGGPRWRMERRRVSVPFTTGGVLCCGRRGSTSG
jgi:hypothetical protein